jgi:hypothetical protein
VLESAAIVKALHAGDRLADGVGIMPVRLVAVAAEEGFDAFRRLGDCASLTQSALCC